MRINNIININTGQPTMWKTNSDGNASLYHVDTFRSMITVSKHIFIPSVYDRHMRDHAQIISLNMGWIKDTKIPSYKWNVTNITRKQCQQFKTTIHPPISNLIKLTRDEIASGNDKTACVDATLQSMCDALCTSADAIICREIIPDNGKPYISKQMVNIIENLRKERKVIIQKIMNRIKNFKITTNGTISEMQI